jgi:hypothetical protein
MTKTTESPAVSGVGSGDVLVVEPTQEQVERALTAWFGTEHWTGWHSAEFYRRDMRAALIAAQTPVRA